MEKLRKYIICLAIILSLSTFYLSLKTVFAEPDCNNPATGDIDYCIAKIETEINALKPAHEYNKKELTDLRVQVASLEKRIAGILKQLKVTEYDIDKRTLDLAYAEEVFKEKTLNHYKFLRIYDPILPFLSAGDAADAFREIAFRAKAATSDINTMEGYAADLVKLKNDKENLEKNKISLSSSKAKVSERASFLAKEVDKTETYLDKLSSRQEELLAQKAGGFETSVGDTPSTAEPCSGAAGSANFCDPGFRPAYGAFSFGAPHRTGMSQYGALGRSKSGQNAETILSAYYQGSELRKDYPTPATIGVTGIGRVAFEENYLLGIYEVPEKWGNEGGFEALKAQAVAARSYALAVTNNGAGNICTTEACQVYKPQLKSGKWAEAVRATRGWVVTKGGAPAKTYFASTSGGFTISQWGWSGIKDVKDDSWPGGAYEKVSGSPWFYKAWFKTRSGATCVRSNPWLKSEELADIVNAWQVLYKGGGDVSRISPANSSCWGGNPYSLSELAGIGGYTSVDSISVVYSNSGNTQTVNVGTNKGSIGISGEEFKRAFNLRAPGYIGIKSGLFNIEKL
ncbi:MAG: SpoIID/LytB domain protein [Candidatus Woesebacteria bacterium GW2011_GWB1_38_8b]|uniref:SpoIID/LytB domain protein n=2 Tax=Candidatus Woeseibacteriota TaxID=1752722 RepID=A0A0G0NKF7_9BACT|nr:MAG: SpoIID/LytB domain protein [Candidatus Woesebacteria bacterium GW2011_GWB1_38_8b]